MQIVIRARQTDPEADPPPGRTEGGSECAVRVSNPGPADYQSLDLVDPQIFAFALAQAQI